MMKIVNQRCIEEAFDFYRYFIHASLCGDNLFCSKVNFLAGAHLGNINDVWIMRDEPAIFDECVFKFIVVEVFSCHNVFKNQMEIVFIKYQDLDLRKLEMQN